MYITGIMERALAGNRIKAAWVCIADVLHLPGQGGDGLLDRQTYNICQDIPGGSTGGTAQHFNGGDPAVFGLHPVFRQSELPAIFTCRLQAAEAASGERRHCISMFFT